MKNILLAAPGSDQGIGCGGGLGPFAELLCNISSADTLEVGNILNRMVSGIVGFLTLIACIWFFIQIILAGFNWIGAGGDKGKTEAAMQKITNALIGLLLVVGAWAVVGVVGTIIGIDILNPGAVLQILTP